MNDARLKEMPKRAFSLGIVLRLVMACGYWSDQMMVQRLEVLEDTVTY